MTLHYVQLFEVSISAPLTNYTATLPRYTNDSITHLLIGLSKIYLLQCNIQLSSIGKNIICRLPRHVVNVGASLTCSGEYDCRYDGSYLVGLSIHLTEQLANGRRASQWNLTQNHWALHTWPDSYQEQITPHADIDRDVKLFSVFRIRHSWN